MVAEPEYYAELVESFPDTESLTVLVVSGSTRDQVASGLGVDLSALVADPWDDEGSTGWAIQEITGGVLAIEQTGYGDPSRASMRVLSSNRGSAAVVRSNIQAHVRFGCAQHGQLLFDDDEYMYIRDKTGVPERLRSLFDLAWVDLHGDDIDQDRWDGFVVGLAMAEAISGVELHSDDVAVAYESGFFAAPTQVYASSLED